MTENTTPDLECRNVTKSFGNFTAVRDVSFSVPHGSFFSILGPSGCGKTTLLRMVAGFLDPGEGDILIKGRSMLEVPPNRRPVNMVFQHLALFPMMNIADNIAYGLRRRGTPKAEIAAKVDAVLERVGLPDVGKRRIDQLSGGQKQRIAIARCMVLEPDVLLLDEPLGALDLKLREHMKVELKKLQSQFQTTFIYITHDQSEALVMSDQVAVMNNGVFEQVGSARDLYYDPQTAFVAGFVGDSNRWRGTVDEVDAGGIKMRTEDGLAFVAEPNGQVFSKGDAVQIFVRPEAVRLSFDEAGIADMDNRVQGVVESVLFNGANSHVLVRDPAYGGEIDVALPQTGEFRGLQRGQKIHIGWRHEQARCFALGSEEAE
ncbi:MAG: ABC transporter ATP-binding protein [Hyphomicrobiales bacterium]|nr:MAG: ABC transporter ATP-binding protein [Hyphomicrobiales bacterium]